MMMMYIVQQKYFQYWYLFSKHNNMLQSMFVRLLDLSFGFSTLEFKRECLKNKFADFKCPLIATKDGPTFCID